jgi:hypothetical protein
MEYKLLSIEEMPEGTRVKLVIANQHYDIDERNPGIGTKWECAGTVVENYGEEVEVEWDNGCVNVYVDNDLTPEKPVASDGGNFRSIW